MNVTEQKTKEGDINNIVNNGLITYINNSENAQSSQQRNVDDAKEGIKILELKVKREFASVGSCMKRLPWLKESCIKEFYVDLTMEERNKKGNLVIDKDFYYNKMFLATTPNEEVPKTILILGGAGFGKSTLTTKIVHDWATKKDSPTSKFLLIILCRLREIRNEEDVEKFIFNWCKTSLECEYERTVDVKRILREARQNLLIILDGYDEICQEQRLSVKKFISKTSFFHSSTFIVTSRPGDLEEDFQNYFERRIYISPLSDKLKESFVDKVFVDEPRKAESVKVFLRDHKLDFFSELSPLLLYSVCSIFEEDHTVKITKSADLIYEVTRIMFLRGDIRENGERTLTEEVLSEILCQLGKLFLHKLQQSQLYFETSEIQAIITNVPDFVKIGLFQLRCGKEGDVWETIHKVFMDVLAVFYLNKHLEVSGNTSEASEAVIEGLGEPRGIKKIFFLGRERNVLAFWGTIREISYVTFENDSLYNGLFYTFEDLKAHFFDYVCRYKGDTDMMYEERSNIITFSETFGNISSLSSKKVNIQVWPTYQSVGNVIAPNPYLRFETLQVIDFSRSIFDTATDSDSDTDSDNYLN